MVKLLENISIDQLINLQNTLPSSNKIVLRFTAEWCGPCKTIKPVIDEYVCKFSDNITFVTIDVDETIDIYSQLKRNKSLNGIPAILVFNGGNRENWFVSDQCVLGGNLNDLKQIFDNLLTC